MTGESDSHAPNRRSHPRQHAKGEVVCRTGKLGMGPVIHGKLLDLSQSGVGMLLPKEVKIGDDIVIELIGVGSGRNIRAQAFVRQAKQDESGKWLVGCQFDRRLPYEATRDFNR